MLSKLVSALIGGVIVAFATFVDVEPKKHITPVVSLPLHGYLGITKCVNHEPMVFISDTLTGDNPIRITRHEMRHVEQHKAFRTCEEMDSLYAIDGHFRVITEADAYCAQLIHLEAQHIETESGRIFTRIGIMVALRDLDSTATGAFIGSTVMLFCGQ